MIKEKALLIVPPTGLYIREERNQVPVNGLMAPSARPPIDLCYMAAVLEKRGIQCRISDLPVEGLSWIDLERSFLDFKPDTLIVSSTIFTFDPDMKACTLAKRLNPRILTITKGAYASSEDVNIMERFPQLDLIIHGEYEDTLGKLTGDGGLADIPGITYRDNGSIIQNRPGEIIADLDSIPLPSRHLINNSLYIRADTGEPMTTIQTARGCPYGCIFCLSGSIYGKKVRKRSAQNIITELKECISSFNIKDFFFRADTFTFDKEWVIGLCREIIEERLDIRWVCNGRVDTVGREILTWMKRAGCWGIALGIESGSQRILDKIKKGITLGDSRRAVMLCRSLGIKSLLYFVMGFPWESREDLLASIRFAKELKGDYTEFHIGVPFPGTEYYKTAKELNLMLSDDFEGPGYSRPIARTLFLSRDEILRFRQKAIRSIYLDPSYITRTLINAGSFAMGCRLLKFGVHKMINLKRWAG